MSKPSPKTLAEKIDKSYFNISCLSSKIEDFPNFRKKIEELMEHADENDIRPLVEKIRTKADKMLKTLHKVREEYLALKQFDSDLTDAIIDKKKTIDMLDEQAAKINKMLEQRGASLLYTEEDEKKVIEEINKRQKVIQKKEATVSDLENELVIKQD